MSSNPVLLAFTDADRWRPGIGDPSLVGWFTVFCYFAAAFLTFRAARRAGPNRSGKEASFWMLLTTVLVILGINKQLDLQTWFTLTGRRISQAQGWYHQRRVLQFIFILLITMGALASFVYVWRMVGTSAGGLWLPLIGLCLLLGFVVVRAASFHHIDEFLRFRMLGMKMNWVLELGAIGVIALGTRSRHSRRNRAPIRPGLA